MTADEYVYIEKIIKEDFELFKQIQSFNTSPADYIHESWLEDLMSPQVLPVLMGSERGRKNLSAMMLDFYHLDQLRYYDFSSVKSRFCLIPPDVLFSTAFYCGIALHHPYILKTVDKKAIARIKSDIGNKAYAFAFKRASLLLGSVATLNNENIASGSFGTVAQKHGTAYLLNNLSDLPMPQFSRLLMKFPKKLVAECYKNDGMPPDANGWLLIKRILTCEIDHKWRQFFV